MKALIHFIKHLVKCKTVPKCWIASLYLKVSASVLEYELYAIKNVLLTELEDFKLCDRQRTELIRLIKFCDYRLGILEKYRHFGQQAAQHFTSLHNNLPFHTSN